MRSGAKIPRSCPILFVAIRDSGNSVLCPELRTEMASLSAPTEPLTEFYDIRTVRVKMVLHPIILVNTVKNSVLCP